MPIYNLEEQILSYVKSINNEWHAKKTFRVKNI